MTNSATSLPKSNSQRRNALTLVEMLIGMAITLLMMAAVVNLFANIGSGIRLRQATIEMSAELRDVRAKLFNDLTHATCPTLPWQRPDEDSGYFEIVEGNRYSDRQPSALVERQFAQWRAGIRSFSDSWQPTSCNGGANITDATGLGDYDDIIAFTVRQNNAPFKGRTYDPNTSSITNIESSVAEVIWFAMWKTNRIPGSLEEPGMRTIYRRQLLVAPWANLDYFNTTIPPDASNVFTLRNSFDQFYQECDVSVRVEQVAPNTYRWVANSLGDLAKRENRFGHYSSSVAFPLGIPTSIPLSTWQSSIERNSWGSQWISAAFGRQSLGRRPDDRECSRL